MIAQKPSAKKNNEPDPSRILEKIKKAVEEAKAKEEAAAKKRVRTAKKDIPEIEKKISEIKKEIKEIKQDIKDQTKNKVLRAYKKRNDYLVKYRKQRIKEENKNLKSNQKIVKKGVEGSKKHIAEERKVTARISKWITRDVNKELKKINKEYKANMKSALRKNNPKKRAEAISDAKFLKSSSLSARIEGKVQDIEKNIEKIKMPEVQMGPSKETLSKQNKTNTNKPVSKLTQSTTPRPNKENSAEIKNKIDKKIQEAIKIKLSGMKDMGSIKKGENISPSTTPGKEQGRNRGMGR